MHKALYGTRSGFEELQGHVLVMHKALYGTRSG